MRKLMFGVLAAGCLTLLVGSVSVHIYAATGGDIEFTACKAGMIENGYNICADDPNPKVRYCHFNEGGDGKGDGHCGNLSSYTAHVGPGIVVGHSQKDFCITSQEEEDLCEAGKTPDPK